MSGCKIQPTNCTTCYNEATGMKYYGTVRSVINMWDWAGGGHDVLKTIREQDLRVNIEVKKWSLESNQYIQSSVYSTEEAPRRKDGIDRVSRVFKVENLIWNIVIEPGSGWAPLWVPYGYLLVCVASVCISLGCTWILIAKFRHETLLQRMLPARVVKHLEKQDGGKVFAESFENVTIFFSGIVL